MTTLKKIGIIVDIDFASKNAPPYPHPSFLSYETPLRIKFIYDYLEKKQIFKENHIKKLSPMSIDEHIINLAHTKYHIDAVKNLSSRGIGLLEEEVYITEDTYNLAKKAIGGAITSITNVLNHEVDQS
ncbi:MAG: hypothetical protein ACFFEY_21115, partial [Candidatus Thorarchaeota archaeon]